MNLTNCYVINELNNGYVIIIILLFILRYTIHITRIK